MAVIMGIKTITLLQAFPRAIAEENMKGSMMININLQNRKISNG
jgi:hypothetical protein